ncbi:hypothetical protein [Microbacterium sp. SY138]|uniref:hypothetical protein n=1 Tax=Microbacterium sp. SY138 TaxID=3149040 RepID=UPI003219440F
MALFDAERARFRDAVLGFGMDNPGMSDTERNFASGFGPNSRADLLRVLGDEHSAVVFSYDTHDMFGAEIWAASAIDVSQGRVHRNVDYWDGRLHPVSAMRAPESHFDTQLAEDAVVDASDPTITRVARGLRGARGWRRGNGCGIPLAHRRLGGPYASHARRGTAGDRALSAPSGHLPSVRRRLGGASRARLLPRRWL